MNYKDYIAIIEDFPIKGISFKDITPLIENAEAYKTLVEDMGDFVKKTGANLVLGPEARGFLFGCPVAYYAGIGFVAVRKPGKLPRKVVSEEYDLEYGKNTICINADAVKPGDKVVVVDDLIATGGTIEATIKMVQKLGGEVVGVCCAIELTDLKGRESFKDIPFYAPVVYPF